MLGLTQSHSDLLGDIEGFTQLIPDSYKSDEPINITGVDKVHLKADCFIGSILNVSENQFRIVLNLISLQVRKYTKNLD